MLGDLYGKESSGIKELFLLCFRLLSLAKRKGFNMGINHQQQEISKTIH